jgi:hypothetical protein
MNLLKPQGMRLANFSKNPNMANEKKFIVTRDLSFERGEVLSGFSHFLFIATDALSEIVEQPIRELQPNDAWTTGTVIGGVRSDHWRETTIPTAEPTVVELPKVGVECREYAMHSVFKHAKYDLLWDVDSEYYPKSGVLRLYCRDYNGYYAFPCSELTLISEPTVKDCLTVEQPIELSDIGIPRSNYNRTNNK